jgi:hypothetical protein
MTATVQLKLILGAEQSNALEATLRRCNEAAVGSWGDTLEEDEVLDLLRHENNSRAGGAAGIATRMRDNAPDTYPVDFMQENGFLL